MLGTILSTSAYTIRTCNALSLRHDSFRIPLACGHPHSARQRGDFRRFNRTPYYKGPNDPERGRVRGT